MKISIDVDGAQTTIAAFEKVERGIIDLRQLGTWDWVQSEYYKCVKEIMSSEGSAGKSGKYAPLTTAYAVAKQKKYGNKPILQATGAMYASATTAGNGAIVDKQAQEMTLGTSDRKAGFHQYGTSKMPARKILDFTPEHEKRILEPIGKKLRQLVDNAKLRDIRGF